MRVFLLILALSAMASATTPAKCLKAGGTCSQQPGRRGTGCCKGLICNWNEASLKTNHRVGTCATPPSQCNRESEMCGGIAGLQCCTGFTCSMPASDSISQIQIGDQTGICKADRATCQPEGGMCGGIAGLRCCKGAQCSYTGGGAAPPTFPTPGPVPTSPMPTDPSAPASDSDSAPGSSAPAVSNPFKPNFPDQAGLCVNMARLPLPRPVANAPLQRSCKNEQEMCGGIAGFVCCPGFQCHMDTPFHPDQAGVCVAQGTTTTTPTPPTPEPTCQAEGAGCGSFSLRFCCDDLECVLPEQRALDQGGVCRQKTCGKDLSSCGGIASLPCCDGYHCVLPRPDFADQMGVCAPASLCGKRGEACETNKDCCSSHRCARDKTCHRRKLAKVESP